MIIKRIILNIFLVFVVTFILDFTIGNILKYFYFKQTSGLPYRTTYSIDSTEAEVLVFGSSRANQHYVPKVFEDSLKLSCYNSGREGVSIFYNLAILMSVLKRYTPQIIILEEPDLEKIDSDYDKLSVLLPYYYHADIRKIIELKSPFEHMKMLSKIYPYNSQILTIAIQNFEINKKRYYDDKGYVPLYRKWKDEIDSAIYITKFETDTNKIFFLKEFINLSKDAGAKVYVIRSPIFQILNSNNEIKVCKEICLRENIPYYDFSNNIAFMNKNLFADIGHLNHMGAISFSKLVVDIIRKDTIHCIDNPTKKPLP